MQAVTRYAVCMPDRVLVIEDSRADVELLELAFRDVGLDVWIDAITSGDEALVRVREMSIGIDHPPDLVVLDLNLPGRSGREVLALIRASTRFDEIPVVVLTGSATKQAELERLGADSYVVKPTRYADLVEIVEELRGFLPGAAV